jgi:copper resistance protein B
MKSQSFVFSLVLVSIAVAQPLFAQHSGHETRASTGSGGLGRPLPPGWEPAVEDSALRWATFVQRAEFRSGDTADAAVLDAEGWVGGDYQRFWWKLEGEQLTERPRSGEVEFTALYSKLFSPFWDVQAGIRVDRTYRGPSRETRGHLVVGLEGLAPYRFEVEPTLALSDEGDVSFELTASYDQLITQRLVLQPRLGLRLDSAKGAPSEGLIGEGLNDLDLGFRVRYDVSRQFSPYVGWEWHRPLGGSAGLARAAGRDRCLSTWVVGVRAWF